jgi:hypothetical protein
MSSADPAALSRFWSALLQQPTTEAHSGAAGVALRARSRLAFVPARRPKQGKNRIHLDLASESAEHQSALVERACALGAVQVDIGQGAVPWVVLADPEGNEFCVLEPRDEYTGIGPVAAVVIDAIVPSALAEFWSHATGLPVTRKDEETASVRQQGGFSLEFVRVTMPKTVENRLHPHLLSREGGDLPTEAARLQTHGALPADVVAHDGERIVLADPEGNEFCVVADTR